MGVFDGSFCSSVLWSPWQLARGSRRICWICFTGRSHSEYKMQKNLIVYRGLSLTSPRASLTDSVPTA